MPNIGGTYFDGLYEEPVKKSALDSKFKKLFMIKQKKLLRLKDKHVLKETFSVSNVKRNFRCLYKVFFKSEHNKYEKFMSDAEKRFNYATVDCKKVVEGL